MKSKLYLLGGLFLLLHSLSWAQVQVERVASVPRPPRDNRSDIVGGRDVYPIEFPFVVKITSSSGLCTGTLIAPDLVLTAAHCIDDTANYRLYFSDGSRRDVSSTHTHPQYVPTDGPETTLDNARYDAALIHLDDPIQNIEVVGIADEVSILSIGATVGWGRMSLENPNSLPKVLQVVPTSVYRVSDLIIGGTNTQGAGPGDSGGPVFFWTMDGWMQGGITSVGIEYKDGRKKTAYVNLGWLDWGAIEDGVSCDDAGDDDSGGGGEGNDEPPADGETFKLFSDGESTATITWKLSGVFARTANYKASILNSSNQTQEFTVYWRPIDADCKTLMKEGKGYWWTV